MEIDRALGVEFVLQVRCIAVEKKVNDEVS